MSEMRLNDITLVGRITRGPIADRDGRVHFLFEASHEEAPFHCICDGRTAENLRLHCSTGDEATCYGELRWVVFSETGRTLIIYVRNISYGRKRTTLR